jgi:hypothetical protein
MERRGASRVVVGEAELTSGLFSNEWQLLQRGEVLAKAVRRPRNNYTLVTLADGTRWTLQPDGWGVVRAVEDNVPFARATRDSFWGNRWEVAGLGFSYLLQHDGRIPRRWELAVGREPAAWLRGSVINYNRVRIDAPISIPTAAALLSWHVIARPWEAVAFAPELMTQELAGRLTDPVPPV